MSREIIAASAVALVVLLVFLRQRSTRRLSLPPGPKPRFWSGNIHQQPQTQPWLTYASWTETYGPLVYFRVYNTQIVVLNKAKAALDLLESRSMIYSDRPQSVMVGVIAGRKWAVPHISSNHPRFRAYRKTLHSGLNPRAVRDYEPIQMQETRTLLGALIKNPEEFVAHIRRNAAALILKISHGYQIKSDNDEYIGVVEEAFRLTSPTVTPGKFWVESFPILRFVPAWLPGAGFKRLAIHIGERSKRIEQLPFDWAKKQIATGDYIESFTSKHLARVGSDGPHNMEEHEIIKWCGAALYAGGADTTVSALTTFFLLMSLYPDIQKQAQLEIEQVTRGRLPTPSDRGSMPYVSAVVKEVVRWGPVAPLGLRHRLMADDVYEGYLIPKGTVVIANIWAITHDEELYPNPTVFDPGRHLGEKAQVNPFKFVFGFGRRVCPGAHLAELSLFLNMASVLATFKITKALDLNGKEIEPVIDWSTDVITHLKPFPCRITPRSKDIRANLGF